MINLWLYKNNKKKKRLFLIAVYIVQLHRFILIVCFLVNPGGEIVQCYLIGGSVKEEKNET